MRSVNSIGPVAESLLPLHFPLSDAGPVAESSARRPAPQAPARNAGVDRGPKDPPIKYEPPSVAEALLCELASGDLTVSSGAGSVAPEAHRPLPRSQRGAKGGGTARGEGQPGRGGVAVYLRSLATVVVAAALMVAGSLFWVLAANLGDFTGEWGARFAPLTRRLADGGRRGRRIASRD